MTLELINKRCQLATKKSEVRKFFCSFQFYFENSFLANLNFLDWYIPEISEKALNIEANLDIKMS
jgi:SET domain-containing protein